MNKNYLRKIVLSLMISFNFFFPKTVISGSYSTVTDLNESVGGGRSALGFSSIEEAGVWAWKNALQLRIAQGVQNYGGIVYKYITPNPGPPNYQHTNYWWGYYWHDGRGPFAYISISYAADRYNLSEYPQNSLCADKEANPCNPSTGAKFQTFIDYTASNNQGLTLKRIYLSQTRTLTQFATGWQHNYNSALDPKTDEPHIIVSSSIKQNAEGLQQSSSHPTAEQACLNGWHEIKNKAYRGLLAAENVQYSGGNLCHVIKEGQIIATLTIHSSGNAGFDTPPNVPVHTLIRSNGQRYQFQQQGTEWSDWQHPEATLVAQGNNWLFTDANDTQELYDEQGRLIQITTRQGLITQLQHDLTAAEGGDDNAKTLDKVIGPFGRTLVFNYQTDEKLISVNTPDGLIQYSYEASDFSISDNLSQVTYPDGYTETYHYEKSAFPHHLTGITDEKGIRYATWDYDDQGRAILSEHAGQADKVTFVYNQDGTTTVTGALGDTRTYHFDWVKGGLQVKKITGDRCQTCGNGHMKERTYDAHGFLASYTDWNGNLTTYTRDATGLELSRTEASGTPQARTITTDWHPDFRVPAKVTQANKVTEYDYDTQGRLLSKTIRNVQ